MARKDVAQALDASLRSNPLGVDQAEHVMRALRADGAGKADVADCLIERTAVAAGCTMTMTVDVGISKAAGMTSIG